MSATTAELAAQIDRAAVAGQAIEQVTASVELTVAEAYRVQEAVVAHRIGRGERLVGIKLGLTSPAKMAQMGVDEVIWGRLTDAMSVPDGGGVPVAGLIHPRVEPEIAFQFGVDGAAVAVAAALEVIDSRYADFRFTLPDVIADNTSAAAYVLGPWRPIPEGLDNLGVLLEVDGQLVESGSTAAILGDPWRAWRQGVALAAAAGLQPQPGWVLLAGAATAAVPLRTGSQVRAVVEQVGTACLEVIP